MATAGLRRRDGVRHHHQHVANGVWRPLLQRRGDRGPGDVLGDLAGLCLDLPLATHAAVGRADRRGADEVCLAAVSADPAAVGPPKKPRALGGEELLPPPPPKTAPRAGKICFCADKTPRKKRMESLWTR